MKSLKLRLESHFVAAAAMAAVAVLGGAQKADASIVSSGPVNILIPATTDGVYLNFVTGANSGSAASVSGWDVNPWSSTTLNMFNPSTPTGGVYVGPAAGYSNLTAGTTIDGTSLFTSGSVNAATPLNFNSDNNFVGVRFTNEATGQVDYAFMQIHLGATAIDPARAIISYSYENTGAGITIPVPTPASLSLLGLGGLSLIRRRR